MLVIGAIFVDVKGFSLGTYHPEGTNIGDVQVVPGGVCRNVAEDLAHMGFEAQFVSMVDDTALGRDVKDSLSALGIDTAHVVAAPKGMGMWLAILDEHGDLRGSISRQPDFSALEDYIGREGEAMVAACDGIVLGYDTNAAITSRMIALAERFDKPIYGLVGNMGVLLRHTEYLRKSTCFICNEIEAEKLFDRPLMDLNPEEMLSVLVQESRSLGVPAMVLTMGAQGAVYVDHRTGEFGGCPAQSVDMVDSTGAGDAFFSGTVAALMRKMPLSQAVRVGTELAARTLRTSGSSCPPSTDLLTEEI
ncbi:MAG: carbohydrate kinase family protein [Clostridia bacterium]|nr:carbohydrate kinase family protein [Clostridia bacterium]